MTTDTTVFVRLLDEGTEVFRPIRATHLFADTYRLHAGESDIDVEERWEFGPGSSVTCVRKQLEGETVLIAVALAR